MQSLFPVAINDLHALIGYLFVGATSTLAPITNSSKKTRFLLFIGYP